MTDPSDSPRRAALRDPYWDTVRWVAGALVVFGHVVDGVADTQHGLLRWLYVATWPLRVPLLALLSGWFSSSAPLTRRSLRRLGLTLLVPYLAVGLLHSFQRLAMTGRWWWHVDMPAWGLWFLLSLLLWRTALPWIVRLRRPVSLSMALALGAGYVPLLADWLALSRTLCFLPFFLIGHRLRQGAGSDMLRPGVTWSRWTAVAVLTALGVAGWCTRDGVSFAWLRMQGPYEADYGLPTAYDWSIRAAVLLIGTAGALALLRLMPRGRVPFLSFLGTGGMYLYVLHPLVLRPLLEWPGVGWINGWPTEVAALACALALAAALASPPVRRATHHLVQPGRRPAVFTDERPAPPRDLRAGPRRSTREPRATGSARRTRVTPTGRSAGTAPPPRGAGTSRCRGGRR